MEHTESPFSGLYKKLDAAQCAAYLRRIGYEGAAEVSFDCFRELMRCQLESVPFENLDVFHRGMEPSLDTDAMFEKIVVQRRGGYCFELNGLFYRLLEALGFSVYCACARIALGRGFLAPPAHRVIIAEVCGKRYFCDVGFGGPIPASPIEITDGESVCAASGRRYGFESAGEETVLLYEREGEFLPMLRFSQKPADPVDFVPLNTFCAKSEAEPFMHRQMLWRMSTGGRCSIDRDVLKIGEGLEVTLKSEEQLRSALYEHFGISFPYSLKEWRG